MGRPGRQTGRMWYSSSYGRAKPADIKYGTAQFYTVLVLLFWLYNGVVILANHLNYSTMVVFSVSNFNKASV